MGDKFAPLNILAALYLQVFNFRVNPGPWVDPPWQRQCPPSAPAHSAVIPWISEMP